ncbi:MAG: hypothetical protein ACLQVD_14780 [Capsulimonadaceae bacterium]
MTRMIDFYDFEPGNDGSLASPLRSANAWIKLHNVNVINVETVLVPESIKPKHAPGIQPSRYSFRLMTEEGTIASHQVIRLWYHVERSSVGSGAADDGA